VSISFRFSVSECLVGEWAVHNAAYQIGSLMDGITFIGTATMIVRLGSFTVLTDPNFLHRGQRAYLGRGLWSQRLTEPAMQPADLPMLNAVVLSHLHGDHFDRIARRRLDRTAPVLTTEHAASRLRRYGFTSHGLQPWTRYELANGGESLTVESLPAVHAYGVLGKLLPPVMGSLLVHRVAGAVRRRVYISGDTLTGDHLDEIRERHPEIDTAVVHLGGTRLLFWTVTMDANQSVDFLQRIRPRLAVPVHYDDYRAFRSPLSEFLSAMKRDLSGQLFKAPARGETVLLGER
jgi:L-ascorbate metabolism protein UlaG (beta-lactamase superfamily)